MLMPKKDLRYLQEKYADLLKNDANSAPSPEIPESDKYDHEKVKPVTKAMLALRWVLWAIFTILSICLVVAIIRIMFKLSGSSLEKFFAFLIFFSICWCLLRISVKNDIVYPNGNRLTITDKELLVHAPRLGYGHVGGLIKLRFPLHEIVDASIRNPNCPELKAIMREDRRFKLYRNTNLFSAFRKPRFRYKYVLCVDSQPISDDIQFVDIEIQGGWRILVEFDDVENFVSVLKRRISQSK